MKLSPVGSKSARGVGSIPTGFTINFLEIMATIHERQFVTEIPDLSNASLPFSLSAIFEGFCWKGEREITENAFRVPYWACIWTYLEKITASPLSPFPLDGEEWMPVTVQILMGHASPSPSPVMTAGRRRPRWMLPRFTFRWWVSTWKIGQTILKFSPFRATLKI